MNEKKTFFLVPSTDPLLEEWKPNIQKYLSGIPTEGHTMHLVVLEDNVRNNDVSELYDAFLVLQHYPWLLQNLIRNISIKFQIPGTDEYYEDYDWISEDHIAWLYRLMNTFPVVSLFIEDDTQRLFGLMGDQILTDKQLTKKLSNKTDETLRLSAEQMNILDVRLFEACRFSLLYVYGSGIDLRPHIEQLLAEYKIKFPYETLLHIHHDDVQNGQTFRLMTVNNN